MPPFLQSYIVQLMRSLTPYDAPRTLFVTHLRNFFCLSENSLPFSDLLHRKTGIRDAGSERRVGKFGFHKDDVLFEICLCAAHSVQEQQLLFRALRAALAAKIFYLDNTFHDMFIITQNVQNVKMLKKIYILLSFHQNHTKKHEKVV